MKTQALCAVFLLGLLPIVTFAADPCNCGGCDKVCKLICTTKTVEVTCYGYRCEELCVPGPSKVCQKHCNSTEKCNVLCRLRWTEWCPGGSKLTHRKKLVKYIVKREVPSFKWVVGPACGCDPDAVPPTVKPAPTEARIGDEFELTEQELRHVSAKVIQKDKLRR